MSLIPLEPPATGNVLICCSKAIWRYRSRPVAVPPPTPGRHLYQWTATLPIRYRRQLPRPINPEFRSTRSAPKVCRTEIISPAVSVLKNPLRHSGRSRKQGPRKACWSPAAFVNVAAVAESVF